MNLKLSFNLNYLLQNLKKSKGVLGVFLGIIPILNIIILMMSISQGNSEIINMTDLSMLNIIGLYIVPIVLSICLFGFVFKKKSVDFVNSMPISKSTIFITNTIGGILILIAMILINAIVYLLFALFSSNFILPIAMIFDYLLIWSISYIFVFTATNLAMTISGNMITQIIVTALVLFLVPFMVDYFSSGFVYNNQNNTKITCKDDSCKPDTYLCYEDKVCSMEKNLGIYNGTLFKYNKNNYTVPYLLISSGLLDNETNDNFYFPVSLAKTGGLIIVQFIIGLFLFKRRKMENCETSFKSIHTHSIVKCLTMTPILVVVAEMLRYDIELFSVVLVGALLIAYFLIYDVITRRGIKELKIGFIYFVAFIVLMTGASAIMHKVTNKEISIDSSDIKAVALSNEYTTKSNDVFVTDKKLINMVVKKVIETNDNQEIHNYYEFVIEMKNGQKYVASLNLTSEEFNLMLDQLISNKKFADSMKIDFNKTYAVAIGNFVINSRDNKELVEYIKKEIKDKEIKDFYKSYPYGSSATAYIYENHQLKRVSVNLDVEEEINEMIASFYNEKALEMFKKDEYDSSFIDQIYFYPTKTDYNAQEYRYIMESINETFTDFTIKTAGKKLDNTKPYVVIVYYYEGLFYPVYSNDINELNEMIEKYRKQLSSSPEYKEFMESLNDIEVQYND